MKLSFGKSEPWNNGWRGWSDSIDVLLNGTKIGELVALNANQKKWMEYQFKATVPALNDIAIHPGLGIRAAKTALRDALASRAALT